MWLDDVRMNTTDYEWFPLEDVRNVTETEDTAADVVDLSTFEVVLVSIVVVVLSVLTAGGNLIVMMSFKMDTQLQTVSNYFLISLSVADFAIGAVSMPLFSVYLLLQRWPFGTWLCDTWLALDYTMSNASVANLLVISFDRYFSVTRPLTYRARRTQTKAVGMIVCAWIVSALLWTPWIYAWPYIEDGRTVPDDKCYIQFLQTNKYLTILTALAAFYLPLTIMAVLFGMIYRETEKRQRCLADLQGGGAKPLLTQNKNPSNSAAVTQEDQAKEGTSSQLRRLSAACTNRCAQSVLQCFQQTHTLCRCCRENASRPQVNDTSSSNSALMSSNQTKLSGESSLWYDRLTFCRRKPKLVFGGGQLRRRQQEESYSCRRLIHDDERESPLRRTIEKLSSAHGEELTTAASARSSVVTISAPPSFSNIISKSSADVLLLTLSSREINSEPNFSATTSTKSDENVSSKSPGVVRSRSSVGIVPEILKETKCLLSSELPSKNRQSSDFGSTPENVLHSEKCILSKDCIHLDLNKSNAISNLFDVRIVIIPPSPHFGENLEEKIPPAYDKPDAESDITSSATCVIEDHVDISEQSSRFNVEESTSHCPVTVRDEEHAADPQDLTDTSDPVTAIPTGEIQRPAMTMQQVVMQARATARLREVVRARRARKQHQEKQLDRKAAKTLSAILLAFVITWTPYNVFILIQVFCADCIPETVYNIGYWLCYINSTINPICYALCNANFRRTYWRIVMCRWYEFGARPVAPTARVTAAAGSAGTTSAATSRR